MEVFTQLIGDGSAFYDWAMSIADPRVAEWPLMATPWPTVAMTIAYLFIVKIGMSTMASRPAYELQGFMAVYNFLIVLLNAYLLWEFVACIYLAKLSFFCAEVDYSDNPVAIRLAKACYIYYLSKAIEFIDTFVFVLRKKNNQVSFLHVYHHASMFPLWWIGIKFVAGGHSYFGATLNSFVHVIMYSYYFLSGFGDAMKPYLWWKRYITQLQLTQFFIVLFNTIGAIYFVRAGQCRFPEWMGWGLLIYMLIFIFLFSAFYVSTYVSKGSRPKSDKTKKAAVKED